MRIRIEELVRANTQTQAKLLAQAFTEKYRNAEGERPRFIKYLVDNLPCSENEERETQNFKREKLQQQFGGVTNDRYLTKRANLKHDLEDFFRNDHYARILPLALQLEYTGLNDDIDCILRVVPNLQCLTTSKIWNPHLQTGSRIFPNALLVHTEPIVFWDDELRCFIRFLDINANLADQGVLDAAIRRYLSHDSKKDNPYADRLKNHHLRPVYHYESSGEVAAMGTMGAYLSGFAREFLPENEQFSIKQELSRNVGSQRLLDQSVIVLGNARTNHLIADLQRRPDLKGLPYTLRPGEIFDTRHDRTAFRDGPNADDNKEPRIFCVVTRWQTTSHSTTVFAANHGRAMMAAADMMTKEEQARAAFGDRMFGDRTLVPPVFQLVCSTRFEDELQSKVGIAQIEDLWIPLG